QRRRVRDNAGDIRGYFLGGMVPAGLGNLRRIPAILSRSSGDSCAGLRLGAPCDGHNDASLSGGASARMRPLCPWRPGASPLVRRGAVSSVVYVDYIRRIYSRVTLRTSTRRGRVRGPLTARATSATNKESSISCPALWFGHGIGGAASNRRVSPGAGTSTISHAWSEFPFNRHSAIFPEYRYGSTW